MAATHATTLAAASAHPVAAPDELPPRTVLSASLLLFRFGTVAALLLAAASFPQSSFFRIREIRIEGARQIVPADLIARSGLRMDDPVTAVPAAEIAARIASHPRVLTVGVHVSPTGRVAVRITERTAAAAIAYQGRFVIIDPAGVAIAERGDAGALPVIEADNPAPPWMRLGDVVPSPVVPQSMQALALLPAELPRAGLRFQRSDSGELVMVTGDRITVRLGRARGLSERTAGLPRILTAIRARHVAVEYLDLRFTGNVILKPAEGGQGAGVGP